MLLFTKFNICDIIYMMKIKFLSKFVILPLILLLSGVILFACGEKKIDFQYSISGNGAVIESGTNQFTAVADDWHEFVGWYNGNVKYSSNQTISVKSSTPLLQARFSTSGKATMNRNLAGLYNTYVQEEGQSGEYFNYSMQSNAVTLQEDSSSLDQLNIDGYIDFGSSSDFALTIGDFAIYYVNTTESATIYIQIGEEKYSFADMGLLTNIFTSLSQPSDYVWSLDNLITKENTSYLINQYFGIKNSMGFVSAVENNENSSLLTISFNSVLEFFQNIADSSENANTLQKLIYALTCEYQNQSMPTMNLKFKTNYQTLNNKEHIKDIEIEYFVSKDYVINFDGDKTTIPSMTFSFKIESFDYGYSDQANSIDSQILQTFPQPTINMINVHTDGEMNFLGENQTIIDKYKIEFDADLNPLALVAFKKGEDVSYYDIEWEKLGFLSFRIYLDPTTAVLDRHNNVGDYINILIDTKNNGANAYVFIGLYNPLTLFTKTYIYNHSFNIPGLISVLDNNNSTENQKVSSNTILNLLTAIVSGGIQLSSNPDTSQVVRDLIFNLLEAVDVDTQTLSESITDKENGFTLALPEIRSEIRSYEQEIIRSTLGIGNTDIELDKIIFGDDEDGITQLEITMNESKTESVVKNSQGQYLTDNGQVIIDNFNNNHKVVTEIIQINLPTDKTQLVALIGSQITATQGKLSDGTIVSTHTNNKGKEKPLEMIIENVFIENGKAKVLLRFIDYPNSLSSLPKIGDEIYKLAKVPYGLILYEMEI